MFSIEKELNSKETKAFFSIISEDSFSLREKGMRSLFYQLDPTVPTNRLILKILSIMLNEEDSAVYGNLYDDGVNMINAFNTLYHETPFIKFGHEKVKEMISVEIENHNEITIIDLGFGSGEQWLNLFLENPEKEFHLYAVDVPQDHSVVMYENFLEKLKALGLDDRTTVIPVYDYIENVDFHDFAKQGYCLVNAALSLHHVLPDYLVENGRQSVLEKIRAFHPDLFTLVEPDSDHNSEDVYYTIEQAYAHYLTIFHALDHYIADEKIKCFIEKNFFGQEIRNIVSNKGKEKVERHERYTQWRQRLEQASFKEKAYENLKHGDNSLLSAAAFQCV